MSRAKKTKKTPKFTDLGACIGARALVRVKHNAGPGQYAFDEATCAYSLHDAHVGDLVTVWVLSNGVAWGAQGVVGGRRKSFQDERG